VDISKRHFSFIATVAGVEEQVLLADVLIRTSIPLRPKTNRWWGRFQVDRDAARWLPDGGNLLIRFPGGVELPAVVVSREGTEVAFRCRGALPEELRTSGGNSGNRPESDGVETPSPSSVV
jgi:hypothetical protein